MHLFLLVATEKNVEAHAEAPHGKQQQEQEPLDVIDHRAQRVDEGVLRRLQHPAPDKSSFIHLSIQGPHSA